ncbi:MAG: helix-turn-helix transcriptional regulator [Theionarchaea archaeon]|nr:helix-turn-helix transcriptional regulator [Theionarchaea archaeon]
MDERLLPITDDVLPYIIFLPSDRDAQLRMLSAVFGSEVNLDILTAFCGKPKVYQKELIETLPYSNKTVINHLKQLVSLTVLKEGMEKQEGENKNVWLKYFEVEPSRRWLIFLIYDPESISAEMMQEIIVEVAYIYFKKIGELARQYNMDIDKLREIFEDGIHE